MKYLGLVLISTLAMAGAAHASAKTITLLGVSGPGGEKLSAAIEKQLGEMYDVVSGDVYKAQAAKLGASGASQDEVATVATALRIDAVIGASIVGTGKNRVLMIAVREGATGRVIARGKYELGVHPPKDKIVADLVKALDMTSGAASAGGGHGSDDAPLGGDTARVTKRAPSRAMSGPVGIAFSIGPSLLGRHFVFDTQTAPDYNYGTLVGLRLQGAIFPFAISKSYAKEHPVLASFGLLGGYAHVFSGDVQTTVGTSGFAGDQYDLLLAGRIPLGHGAIAGFLQVEGGWQHLAFYHDNAVGIPNVSYEFLDLGLSWDRKLGVDWAQLFVHFAYLQPLAAGDVVSPAQYGRASAWGIEAAGGVTFFPLRWLSIGLEARYERVGLTFKGTGTLAANEAADSIPSGRLSVGFAL
jgi:hypothetical protein